MLYDYYLAYYDRRKLLIKGHGEFEMSFSL